MPEEPAVVSAYISAGSNVEPQKNLIAALEMLRTRLQVVAVSTVYRTPALGRPDDPDFLNCVFEVRTDIAPRALKFDVLRPIEEALGRDRGPDRYGPRTIDLDLVLCGATVIDEPDLTLPHPDLSRWFVRIPLLELAPGLRVPGSGHLLSSVKDIDSECGIGAPVTALTESLRRRLRL
jgi:2-amino-4-hydroxy-6-hydroxymethyldihydropteridine diphosphokinase